MSLNKSFCPIDVVGAAGAAGAENISTDDAPVERSRLFRSILARYDISLNEQDFFTICNSYGREQEIKYDAFIRMCLR